MLRARTGKQPLGALLGNAVGQAAAVELAHEGMRGGLEPGRLVGAVRLVCAVREAIRD